VLIDPAWCHVVLRGVSWECGEFQREFTISGLLYLDEIHRKAIRILLDIEINQFTSINLK